MNYLFCFFFFFLFRWLGESFKESGFPRAESALACRQSHTPGQVVLLVKNGDALEDSRMAFFRPDPEVLTTAIRWIRVWAWHWQWTWTFTLLDCASVSLVADRFEPREVTKVWGGRGGRWVGEGTRERGNKCKHCWISIFYSECKVTSGTLDHIEHGYYFTLFTNIKLHRSISERFRLEHFLQVWRLVTGSQLSVPICHPSPFPA